MKEYNEEIEGINTTVSDCIRRILIEFKGYELDSINDTERGVAYIAFHLGQEYFYAARDLLKKERVVGGGSLIRACIENQADIFYIFKNAENTKKYAQPYVESIESYSNAVVDMKAVTIDEVFKARMAKQVNKWTNASIEDRIKDAGASVATVYDMFSYFSHPNPAAITYMGNKNLRKKQINIMQQCNAMIAVALMTVVIKHANIRSVTYDELNTIGVEIGFPILQPI